MAPKQIRWSDDDKAAAYVIWVTNDKNIRKTSRDTGVSHTTIGYWVKEWEKNGPPEGVADKLDAAAHDFIGHASRIRKTAMEKLEELIPQAESKQLSAIATVVGIMDDKIRLASGLATKRTENTYVLPSRDDMKTLMSGFVDGLVSAAESRAGEIIDVEVEEQPELAGLLETKG